MRFCKDCRFQDTHWLLRLIFDERPTCGRLEATESNYRYLVDGKQTAWKQKTCSLMRAEGFPCGPDGKLWEAKS